MNYLLQPKKYQSLMSDKGSKAIMDKTIAFGVESPQVSGLGSGLLRFARNDDFPVVARSRAMKQSRATT